MFPLEGDIVVAPGGVDDLGLGDIRSGPLGPFKFGHSELFPELLEIFDHRDRVLLPKVLPQIDLESML